MLVTEVEICNVKTFWENTSISFQPGFNVLVGSNNAGKTTLLRTICLIPSISPHLSEASIPVRGELPHNPYLLRVKIALTIGELRRWYGSSLSFPLINSPAPESETDSAFRAYIESDPRVAFLIEQSELGNSYNLYSTKYIGGAVSTNDPVLTLSTTLTFVTGKLDNAAHAMQDLRSTMESYANVFRQRLYYFSAARRPQQSSASSGSPTLDGTAANLAYCLNHLQTSNNYLYGVFCQLVERILPTVRWIQSIPTGSGTFSIYCLPTSPTSQRDDLAIGLDEMGAGVGNILAVLYVVLTARDPQVIAIDEPNAYLHPRALRALLAILESEGSIHQYFLTAHSAEVLTAIKPATVTMLSLVNGATNAAQVSGAQLHALQTGLADIGIRITDLHSKDMVMWVEGQTEELVIPSLLKLACPILAASIGVIRVEHTGDFETKRRSRGHQLEIYRRLSQSSGLVPPLFCVLLDGEARALISPYLKGNANAKYIKFLKRRMLENYILDADAICATIQKNAELDTSVLAAAVENALESAICQAGGDYRALSFDAAKVLERVFGTIAGPGRPFQKTKDVPTMIDWILEHKPAVLLPLLDELRELLSAST